MTRPTIAPTGYWDAEKAHLVHTTCPLLADWIARFLSSDRDTPLRDFGCGVGGYMKRLEEAGFRHVLGFEGAPPLEKVCSSHIAQHDLTVPLSGTGARGNVLCLEVAEHIPDQFESVFLDTLTDHCAEGRFLILSWAVPGQGGDGHVNCRTNEYAIERMKERGLTYMPIATQDARQFISDTKLFWFKNTLMVFKRI